jgi:ribose/xylose/arabinose/galactoside ABC-type transport system permease subunit
MMTALRGVAYTITRGVPIFGFPDRFVILGQGYVWIIPIPVIVMAIVFFFGWVVLTKTRYGRYIYGIGGNEEASRLSGINVKRIKMIAYGISAGLCGIAGVVLVSRVNSGAPILGTNYELEIITAVVLGGISMSGGEGKITSVVLGVIIMGVLANGMILMGLREYTQWIVKGIVLLMAVSFDSITTASSQQMTSIEEG